MTELTMTFSGRRTRAYCAAMLVVVLGGLTLGGSAFAQQAGQESPLAELQEEPPQAPAGERPLTVAGEEPAYQLLRSSLLSSERSRHFAVEVRTLIDQGDTESLVRLLADTLETGTTAALVIDLLKSPQLLELLRGIEDPPLSRAAAAGAPRAEPPPVDERVAELETALDLERQRADAVALELAAARAELAVRATATAPPAGQPASVSAPDASTADQDAAALKAQIAALQADADTLAQTRAALDRERARAADAESLLAQKAAAATLLVEQVESEKQRANAAAKREAALRRQLAALAKEKADASDASNAGERRSSEPIDLGAARKARGSQREVPASVSPPQRAEEAPARSRAPSRTNALRPEARANTLPAGGIPASPLQRQSADAAASSPEPIPLPRRFPPQ